MHPFFALGLPHGWELFGIIAMVVLLFGADKIPKLARGLGRSLGEFKKAKDEFEKEIHTAAHADDVRAQQEQAALAQGPTLTPTTPPTAVPIENGLSKKI